MTSLLAHGGQRRLWMLSGAWSFWSMSVETLHPTISPHSKNLLSYLLLILYGWVYVRISMHHARRHSSTYDCIFNLTICSFVSFWWLLLCSFRAGGITLKYMMRHGGRASLKCTDLCIRRSWRSEFVRKRPTREMLPSHFLSSTKSTKYTVLVMF